MEGIVALKRAVINSVILKLGRYYERERERERGSILQPPEGGQKKLERKSEK
jgi:hypothetical protein